MCMYGCLCVLIQEELITSNQPGRAGCILISEVKKDISHLQSVSACLTFPGRWLTEELPAWCYASATFPLCLCQHRCVTVSDDSSQAFHYVSFLGTFQHQQLLALCVLQLMRNITSVFQFSQQFQCRFSIGTSLFLFLTLLQCLHTVIKYTQTQNTEAQLKTQSIENPSPGTWQG